MRNQLRTVINRLHLQPTLQRLRALPYILLVLCCRLVRHPDQRRILALTDSHGELQGNLKCVVDAAAARGYSVRSILKNGLGRRRRLSEKFRLAWDIAGAGTILLDDFYPLIYPLKLNSATRIVQLWHASGAFKRVGFSRMGLPGGPASNSITHANYTDAITSAESIRKNYAEAFRLPIERVHATGVPRTDMFFADTTVAATRSRIRDALGIAASQTFVVYAPTFRGNGQLTAQFSDTIVDWTALAAELPHDTILGIKRHPFVVARQPLPDSVARQQSFRDLESGWDMDELLMAADVLVTDYSSVIFDFALLNRPIVFHCPDLDEYTATRDFYYPFECYVVGTLTTTTSELVEAIRRPKLDVERMAKFRAYFCDGNDGHATQRVVDTLIAAPFDGWSNPR